VNLRDEIVPAIHLVRAAERSRVATCLCPYYYRMVSQYDCTELKALHSSLRICRVQSVDSWKNALMNDDPGTLFERGYKVL
jgi:hypothetical protein